MKYEKKVSFIKSIEKLVSQMKNENNFKKIDLIRKKLKNKKTIYRNMDANPTSRCS